MGKRLVPPDLVIGDLHINPPIIQGGMGVLISSSRLAAAVANEGALGVIAAVGASKDYHTEKNLPYRERSYWGLRQILSEAKALSNGSIAVNIMCVLSDYDELVKAAVGEKVAAIISGAGLPLHLPELAPSTVKLIPVVSSVRAASIICRSWWKRYQRLPDAFVVEGTSAGGHLGFSMKEIAEGKISLENIIPEVVNYVKEVEKEHNHRIPIIAAGGIFTGEDIARFLKLGASGVQMGTRFVCTEECDASPTYKQVYLDCKEEDIVIVESPVKLPIRVIRNSFIAELQRTGKKEFKCRYHCLKNCDPKTSPYCIAEALTNAAEGNISEGLITCGSNAYRIKRIQPVKELIAELVDECRAHMTDDPLADES